MCFKIIVKCVMIVSLCIVDEESHFNNFNSFYLLFSFEMEKDQSYSRKFIQLIILNKHLYMYIYQTSKEIEKNPIYYCFYGTTNSFIRIGGKLEMTQMFFTNSVFVFWLNNFTNAIENSKILQHSNRYLVCPSLSLITAVHHMSVSCRTF